MEEVQKRHGKIEKAIDFLFSNDERKWLILIFILGIILRFLTASNIAPLADEAVHGPHSIGFLHSGLISSVTEAPLWKYLTDIGYNVLGITFFSARFCSFLFGSLTILLVYLLASKIFNKKIGVVSAFLLSISYFTVRFTLAEMDLTATFFLVLAIYSFIISSEKKKFPWLAAICIGLASLVKTLSLFFVPAFLIAFFIFYKYEQNYKKKNIKNIILFGFIVLLFFSPIIIHNYLWYKNKGIMDIYFLQYFAPDKAKQIYPEQGSTSILSSNFFKGIAYMFKRMFMFDPLIFIMGLLGILLAFIKKENKKYLVFLISFELSGFILLLISSNWLDTHYTTLFPILCIFGALLIYSLVEFLSKKINFNKKNVVIAVMITMSIILLFQMFLVQKHLFSSCGDCKMRNYAMESMNKDSIVIADSRIYRGEIVWIFNDFHYIESNHFSEMLSINQNLSGTSRSYTVYFLECVIDDCGWGTIKNQPEFNKSVEDMINFIKNNSVLEKVIYGGGGFGERTDIPYFNLYKTKISLNQQIYSIIDSTHNWYYYPINYIPKEMIFDSYSINGIFDKLIYKIAWIIVIMSIILAILFIAIPFKEIIIYKG